MTMTRETVSVVVPTTGRSELIRALASVGRQDLDAAIEIIVVVDAVEIPEVIDRLPIDLAVSVISTGGGAGVSSARNLGVDRSSGRWIAFLDDDDAWDRNKLSRQVAYAAYRAGTSNWPIICSRVRQQACGSKRAAVTGVPARLYEGSTEASDYLFRRRRPGSRRAMIHPSSILVDGRLARAMRWNDLLTRHEDWDWIIRASRHQFATLYQMPDELVTVYMGSKGSVSAKPDWASSLEWARKVLRPNNTRTYVDFLTAQTLRYSIQARDLEGIKAVLGEIYRTGSVPSFGPSVTGMAGLLTRGQLQDLMRWVK
jgi:glycosyltransferase involved in cell wall biosynthesis